MSECLFTACSEMSCHVVLCHVKLDNVTLRNVMLRCAKTCYVLPWLAMLCYGATLRVAPRALSRYGMSN